MNVRDILVEARRLIATFGWQQGAAGGFTDGFCVYGAVAEAIFDDEYQNGLSSIRSHDVLKFLSESVGTDSIISWNDRRGRSKEEVLELFDNNIYTLDSAQVPVSE